MNLWDNIPPKRLLEFFWAFPWGKSSTIAIQYPKIQKQFGFRSFPGQWNSFQTWSKIPSTKGRQRSKPLHQPRPSWLEHLCRLRNRRKAEISKQKIIDHFSSSFLRRNYYFQVHIPFWLGIPKLNQWRIRC